MGSHNGHEPTRFIITVDTETYKLGDRLPRFEDNIYGDMPEGSFGIAKIMDICEKHGAKATFFVDVYMRRHYGSEKVEELCRRIHQRGHDVQLHAHVSWLREANTNDLCGLPLDRQVEVIAEGKECIRRAIGKPPVAFRAGAYAANLDSIEALRRNNILVDSSYFAYHRRCPLSRQLENRYGNRSFYIDGVFEIPVTAFWIINQPFYRKITKTDINASSLAEMSEVIPQLLHHRLRYVVLFLHSFSFIRWQRDFSAIVPNHRAIERFDKLLQRITQWEPAAEFCTMEAASCLPILTEQEPDFIPTVSSLRLVPRAVQRILET
jgi:peptidoglycan/xylan/chitin deacetylase (PgdA/CDA1 family)